MIQLRDHHVRINGTETFLYGAEFHYFRSDRTDWKERMQQIRQAGFNLVSTYVPWIWHEFEENQCDLTGSTHERRDLEYFLSLCAEMGLYCIVRPGPYVMSELKNAGIPSWLLEKYPETLARDKEGAVHPTDVVSYLHPQFLGLVKRWYENVCRVVKPQLITNGGPVIMFQLDNEIGMLHWVSNTSDYSPESMDRFQAFLETRYGSVAVGNRIFGTTAHDFAELARQLAYHPEASLKAHWIWGEYRRYYTVEYVRKLKEMAVEFGITVPFIVNVHGFKDFSIYSRGTDYPIGLSQLRDVSDVDDVVVAGDFYPGSIGYDNFHDLILSCVLTESISRPDQVLFSAEFQSGRLADRPRLTPKDLDLITRLCVSQGMNALNYYMFCGGDNVGDTGIFGRRHEWQAPITSTGTLRPSYETARYLGSLYQAWGKKLSLSRKKTDLSIGFYSPYYMTETVARDGSTPHNILHSIETQREHFHFDGVWRSLVASNIGFDAIELSKNTVRSEGHPVLWVATTQYMDEHTQRKLVSYLEEGGHLIIGPELPDRDLDDSPCSLLADAIGAKRTGTRVRQVVTAFGVEQVYCTHYNSFQIPPGTEPYITGEKSSAEEDPVVAGFGRSVGRGRVTVLGVAFTDQFDYYREVMQALCKAIGIAPGVQVQNRNIFASERRGPEGAFLSLINTDHVDHVSLVYRDGVTAFDGYEVRVAANSGKLLPLEWSLAPGLILEYTTVEIRRMEINSGRVALTLSIPAYDVARLRFRNKESSWNVRDPFGVLVPSEEPNVCQVAPGAQNREIDLIWVQD